MRDLLRISMQHEGRAVNLRLSGELDASTIDMFTETLQTACASYPASIGIDLTDLTFCDSSGLRRFVSAAETCAAQGTQLLITGAQPIVRRVFAITGLEVLLSDG
jgi:anti-anti-sigma factor